MSLTVTTRPDDYSLLKNPVVYKVETDNAIETSGSEAVLDITFSAKPSDGETIKLVWNDVNITLTWKDAPTNSGYHLPTTGASLNDHLELLLPELNKNYYLARDYTISKTSATNIRLTAKATGTDFNITVTEVSSNFSSSLTAGVNEVIRPNYRVYCIIFARFSNEASYSRIFEDSQPPINNVSTFDISEILQTFESTTPPALTVITNTKQPKQLIEYYVQFTDGYGNPIVKQGLITETAKRGIIGGFNDHERLLTSLQTLLGEGEDNDELLTLRFKARVAVDQLYLLNFLNITGSTTIQWRADLIYSNPSDNETVIINTPAVNPLEIICLAFTPQSIGNIGSGTSTFIGFYIYAFGAENSQKVYITIDNAPKPDRLQFIYKTSLGVYETQWAHGTQEHVNLITHEYAEKWQESDSPIETARFKTYGHRSRKKINANSQSLSKTEALHYLDFLSSPEVYLILNSQKVPVEILADEFATHRSLSDMNNTLAFTLQFPESKNYSHVTDLL